MRHFITKKEPMDILPFVRQTNEIQNKQNTHSTPPDALNHKSSILKSINK